MSTQLPEEAKFGARYRLAIFVFSNWVYKNLIVHPENGIATFDHLPEMPFQDKMFYAGAYEQISQFLVPPAEQYLAEIKSTRTLLLQKDVLKNLKNLNENKIRQMMSDDPDISSYTLLVGQRLGQSVLFDDVMPDVYTSIDTSDSAGGGGTLPLHLVFSLDSDTLQEISDLLDMTNTTAVDDSLTKLRQEPYLSGYEKTFNLISLFAKG